MSQKNSVPAKKFLCGQQFWVHKNNGFKIIVGSEKNFGSEKIFGPKIYVSEKNLGSREILGLKKFFGPKELWVQKIMGP